MTPKEKAKKIFEKFSEFIPQNSWASKNYSAIECTYIAVDEILNELFEISLVTGSGYVHKHIDYYQEVKQEIENL
jgi:hypothetical protein